CVARHDEGRGPAVLCGDVPSVCAVSVLRPTLTVVDGEAIEDDSDQVTAEDVAYFNREAMRDLAVKGRIAGLAVMIIGVVGGLAWLWVTIRTQQHVLGRGFTFGPGSRNGGVPFTARVDSIAATIGILLSSALSVGVGTAILLVSNHLTVVHGGTL